MKNQDSNDMATRGSRLPTPICSALHDHSVELWNMVATASIRSLNQEWSDERFEAETVRFTKRLGEIISQNNKVMREGASEK